MDDDSFVRVDALMQRLQGVPDEKLYMGWIVKGGAEPACYVCLQLLLSMALFERLPTCLTPYCLELQPYLPAFLSCCISGRLLTWMSCFGQASSRNIYNPLAGLRMSAYLLSADMRLTALHAWLQMTNPTGTLPTSGTSHTMSGLLTSTLHGLTAPATC